MFRTEDVGHDIAAKRRTGPENQFGLCIDAQVGAVGAKTGTHPGRHAGAEIAAIVGRADQDRRRFVFLNQIDKRHRVGFSVVVVILGAFHQIDLVGAASEHVFGLRFHTVADENAGQFFAKLVGQFATFAEQFMRYALDFAMALLDEYPDSLVLGFVHRHVSFDFLAEYRFHRADGNTGAAHRAGFRDIRFAIPHLDRAKRATRNTGSATNAFFLIDNYSHFIVPPCLRLLSRRQAVASASRPIVARFLPG